MSYPYVSVTHPPAAVKELPHCCLKSVLVETYYVL
jgi:hypothetical protein